MTLSHIVKRYIHSTAYLYRGPVAHQGWYPRDHMPGNYPKNDEERRLAAIKYGLRPEDYKPYHPTEDALNHMGDYPDFGVVTYGHKDPYEDYSDVAYNRNWSEPLTRQATRYRPDRWSYNGLDEEDYEIINFLSRMVHLGLGVSVLLMIFYVADSPLTKLKATIEPRVRMPQLPKQYSLDYMRAFPFEDPMKYPILNYSFEPAEKSDSEGDNAKAPFNPTQRNQL